MDLFHLFFKSSIHNAVPLEQPRPFKLFRDNLNRKTRTAAGTKEVKVVRLGIGEEMSNSKERLKLYPPDVSMTSWIYIDTNQVSDIKEKDQKVN